MDNVHPSSPQEVRPEGSPEGLIYTGFGSPKSVDLQHTQPAAVVTGSPVSAVMQNPTTDGATGSPVSPDVLQIQAGSESYGTASDSETPYSKGDGTYCHDYRIVKRKQRSKRKSSKISVTNSVSGVAASKDPPQTKPLLKADIPKKSGPFLWNSGGKKVQFPKDVSPPKTMVIDGVTIYIQLLTSEEAKACGVIGWDSVLADTKRFRPEIAERKISDFWANWRHSRVMARRLRSQTHSNPTPGPSAETVGSVNSLTGPSVEAGGSSNSNSSDTPSVDAAKRKRTGTPGSAEPPTKKSSLVDGQAYSRVAGAVPATTKITLPHFVGAHTQCC